MRAISDSVSGRRVIEMQIHDRRLRWPVPNDLAERICGQRLSMITRRAKYLLFEFPRGTMLVHLGMSGSLRLCSPESEVRKHDHVRWRFTSDCELRLHDPRRFGAVLWSADVENHPLIRNLGPEPLGNAFSGPYLYQLSRTRRASVKSFIMDARVVVGVGNIYAAESLFLAGIHPKRAAGRIGEARYELLAGSIREVLGHAIDAKGTTLRDFQHGAGESGEYASALNVYGRAGLPCPHCANALSGIRLGQRATVFCSRCQR
jgi:formamidopyrimidine-DNA glycosylase